MSPLAGILLCFGAVTIRGSSAVGDSDAAAAARIEELKDENAKLKSALERVRAARLYWQDLNADPGGGGASSAEREGHAASFESPEDDKPERRLDQESMLSLSPAPMSESKTEARGLTHGRPLVERVRFDEPVDRSSRRRQLTPDYSTTTIYLSACQHSE